MTRADFESRPATFYDCRDSESLTYTSVEEAVEDLIDAFCDRDCDVAEVIRKHGPVTVTAYERRPVSESWIEGQVSSLIEFLSDAWQEEYGDADGEPEEAPPETRAAVEVAVRAFATRQRVWPCEKVGEYTYSVEEVEAMMRKYRADWFEEAGESHQ